jgi:hypothetical protein
MKPGLTAFTRTQRRTNSAANTTGERPRRRLGGGVDAHYQRYHIPASVRVLWGSALATVEPRPPGHLRLLQNDDRAPLLFISGGEDHLQPPSVPGAGLRPDAARVDRPWSADVGARARVLVEEAGGSVVVPREAALELRADADAVPQSAVLLDQALPS